MKTRKQHTHSRMTDIIKIPCYSTPLTMHFGSESNYQRFVGTAYFICEKDKDLGAKKHRITGVTYDPDSVYGMTDGHAGNCWKVTVANDEDGSSATYSIRNWIDIVRHYQDKGFEFYS